jgi:hypothetical protein
VRARRSTAERLSGGGALKYRGVSDRWCARRSWAASRSGSGRPCDDAPPALERPRSTKTSPIARRKIRGAAAPPRGPSRAKLCAYHTAAAAAACCSQAAGGGGGSARAAAAASSGARRRFRRSTVAMPPPPPMLLLLLLTAAPDVAQSDGSDGGGEQAWREMPAAKRAAVQVLTAAVAPRLPGGSYAGSCRGCKLRGYVLRCVCQDGHGGETAATINTMRCKEAENDHGRLVCKRGTKRGGGDGAGRPPPKDRASKEIKRHAIGSDGTFSQNYQDTWVMRLAAANGWVTLQSRGTFFDLGAFNGEYCSNTKLLEDILGWRGVCVEPFPNHPKSPSRDSFSRRKCVLVERALTGSKDGEVVRMHGGHDAQSMQLTLGKGSSASAAIPEGGAQAIGSVTASQGAQVGVTKTISIQTLLDCVNASRAPRASAEQCGGLDGSKAIPLSSMVHFVSLDVEGLEFDVLQNWPFEVSVGAWIVEHNFQEPKRARVKSLLESHGYLRRDGACTQPGTGVSNVGRSCRVLLLSAARCVLAVANNGVDDYYVAERFWPAGGVGEALLQKAWRTHPAHSHNC